MTKVVKAYNPNSQSWEVLGVAMNGWSPLLAVVSDVDRRVLRVVDWVGGSGSVPPVLGYVGATGLVQNIADAIDIRGPSGLQVSIVTSNVSQATSRTTGVTVNSPGGLITLATEVGSTTWKTFTVSNSLVGANDKIIVNQQTGTDKYMIHVTKVANGSFDITFATTGGTTTERPVFSYGVIHGATT